MKVAKRGYQIIKTVDLALQQVSRKSVAHAAGHHGRHDRHDKKRRCQNSQKDSRRQRLRDFSHCGGLQRNCAASMATRAAKAADRRMMQT